MLRATVVMTFTRPRTTDISLNRPCDRRPRDIVTLIHPVTLNAPTPGTHTSPSPPVFRKMTVEELVRIAPTLSWNDTKGETRTSGGSPGFAEWAVGVWGISAVDNTLLVSGMKRMQLSISRDPYSPVSSSHSLCGHSLMLRNRPVMLIVPNLMNDG